ncbi:MAG: GNAT family N-acetyltransferase [Propionibacteriaceae bacterium]|jgi:ribosomal-protein-alanine N-acetyltransferase|nr:GNAT family N-acetyltransferase [Propionibacteriaceae bacterium]
MVDWWPVTLRRQQVVLRPLRLRDEAAWAEIRRRGADWFKPWDATRPPESTQRQLTFGELVRSYRSRARRGTTLPLAVTYSPQPGAKPVFCGQLTVSGISGGSASWGMIGYWIDPRYAGRGIIPLAVAMVVDYCFQTIGLHRIEIAIVPSNAKSVAVVRKLGLRLEGRRPKFMHVGGAWQDHDVYVVTPEEVPEGLVSRYEARQAAAGQADG